MRLTQFYANSPVCSPTRAALLTGRYPDAVGVPGVIRTHAANSWGYLSADAVLLPAVLKKAGYRTGIVGKWHLGLGEPNLPNLRGFDFFHGFLGDMMDDYRTHLRHGNNYMRLNAQTVDPPEHATDVFTQWACQWLKGDCPDFRPSENGTVPLEQRKGDSPVFAETKTGTVPKAKTGTVPFFLYLAYNAPHDPIQPPDEWLAKYKARNPEATEKRAKLAALIEHLDDGVGRVLATLKETGQADNTLVIFVSDNGGSLPVGANNGPLNNGKGTMLEGGIRVPMCAAWPGRIKPGSTNDRVALTMDLFPTICEAAGATRAENLDGRSILPTLLGKPQPAEDRTLFWVRLEGGGRYAGGVPFYAARRGDWKLLQNFPKEPLRLYNLKDDPGETTDLAVQQPQVYANLKKALDEHIARCQRVPYRAPGGIGPGEISK
jgi:arylsulfatase A-like enzyme